MTVFVGIVFFFNNTRHGHIANFKVSKFDLSQSLQKQNRRNTDYLKNDSLASEQKLFAQVERFPEYTLKDSL